MSSTEAIVRPAESGRPTPTWMIASWTTAVRYRAASVVDVYGPIGPFAVSS